MIVFTDLKILTDVYYDRSLSEEARTQLAPIIRAAQANPLGSPIEFDMGFGWAHVDGCDFCITQLPKNFPTLVKRYTAFDEHTITEIPIDRILGFLNIFAEESKGNKGDRLPYDTWRKIANSNTRIYIWKMAYGEYELEVPGLNYFHIGCNGALDRTLARLFPDTTDNKEKENTTMDIKSNMNFDFGPCGDGVAMSPYGLAIRHNGTWLTYNPATNQTVDVSGAVFHMKGMIYKMPTAVTGIQVGDLIYHQSKPMYVTLVEGNKIEAVDICASEAKTIVPVTNIFGFNFITKIASLIGENMMGTPSPDQPFGNIMPMIVMSKIFDGKDGGSLFDDEFVKMMVMCNMLNKGGNPFETLFNFGNNK